LGHPSQGISKTYEVLLRYPLGKEDLLSWRAGVFLEGKNRIPLSLEILSKKPENCWIRLVLQEGLKREIRLMAEHHQNKVLLLRRVAFGKLSLENLRSGEYRTFSKKRLWCMIHYGGSV
jgi:23S rRNA pseudouridine2605 synthase